MPGGRTPTTAKNPVAIQWTAMALRGLTAMRRQRAAPHRNRSERALHEPPLLRPHSVARNQKLQHCRGPKSQIPHSHLTAEVREVTPGILHEPTDVLDCACLMF